MPGEDLFVVGANAVLELGPGALNLMGAMRGGRIVAEGLRDLMWNKMNDFKNRNNEAASAAITGNQFSLLNSSDESSDDSSDDSDDSGYSLP